MNKSELVDLLRDPSKLSANQLSHLAKIVAENPSFLSARLLLAKGSKTFNHPQAKKLINSASIHATDRVLFKKYLSGDLLFLNKPSLNTQQKRKKVVTAKRSEQSAKNPSQPRKDVRPSALKVRNKKPTPNVPVPSGGLDEILEELKQDMLNLKSSRAHFVEVQENLLDEETFEENTEQPAPSQTMTSPSEENATLETKEIPTVSQPEEETTLETKEIPTASQPEEETSLETKEIPTVSQPEEIPAKKPPISPIEEISEEEEEIFNQKLKALTQSKSDEVDSTDSASNERKAETPKAQPKMGAVSTPEKRVKKTSGHLTEKEEEIEKKKIPEARPRRQENIRRQSKTKSIDHSEFGERAQNPFKESRFDKSATRSYVNTFNPPDDFLAFDDEDLINTPKQSEKQHNEEKKKNKSTDSNRKKPVKEKRKEKEKIINKFIKESPSISYTKDKEYSTENLAQESSSWDISISSEYLAEIYLKQDNKKRAIEIYNALGLKYPEKKSYFADLISKIK